MAITTTNTCCTNTTGPLFPSNITITDSSTTLTVAETTGAFRLENFNAVTGDMVTLAYEPIINSMVVDKNGQVLPYSVDWYTSGKKVHFNANVLDLDDDVSIRYVTSASVDAAAVVAVGTISTWSGDQGSLGDPITDAPTGWILCYGQSVNKAGIYADLFTEIGTEYGSGDHATLTFSIPNLTNQLYDGATSSIVTLRSIIKF